MKKKLAFSMACAMALSSAMIFLGAGTVMAEENLSDQVIAERKAAAEESGEYDVVNLAFFYLDRYSGRT